MSIKIESESISELIEVLKSKLLINKVEKREEGIFVESYIDFPSQCSLLARKQGAGTDYPWVIVFEDDFSNFVDAYIKYS